MAACWFNCFNFVHCPASVESGIERHISNAKLSCPCSYGLSFTGVCYRCSRASVKRLLFNRCPSAILFTVSFVIINPIERFVLWCYAHVVKKALKLSPLFTNSNSSAAITRIVIRVFVRATANHVHPSHVCLGKFAVSSMAVCAFHNVHCTRELGYVQ